MITLTFMRQILNLIRDMIFILICVHPIKKKATNSIYNVLGYAFLFLTLTMYSAESTGIFSYATTRTLFRTFCYFMFLYNTKTLEWKTALYDALFFNTICTITHNLFLTPLTRPILLNTVQFVSAPVVNWLISFLIVNIVVVSFDFIIYKTVPIQQIKHVDKTRFVPLFSFMIGSIYLNNTLRLITDFKLQQIAELSTYAIISQLTLFCCIILLEQIQDKSEKEVQAHIEAISARTMMENIKKQTINDDKIQQIRHDLKNHLSALYCLLNIDQKEECLKYIEQLSDDYTQESFLIHTGHSILDHIVSQKLGIAESKKITTSFSADFSKLVFLNNTDACIIFANLLDNAIEATEKVGDLDQRFIDIHGSENENYYIYTIENSYNGCLIAQDNRFLSTKDHSEMHGIGLQSVLNAMTKYDAILHLEPDKELLCFKVVLIFPIPSIH